MAAGEQDMGSGARMHLIIFGATGPTGQQLVQQALARGHQVRAFVRDPAKVELRHDNLEVVQGDMLDPVTVDRALARGADAIVLALGIFHRQPLTELSEGTSQILASMKKHGLRRLAVVTSLGVGDSAGQGDFLARMFQKLALKHVLADKERQEQLVRDSDLDWTVVRPPRLMNRAPSDRELVAWQGPTPRGKRLTWQTARASVAAFVLDVLARGAYIKAAVNISEQK